MLEASKTNYFPELRKTAIAKGIFRKSPIRSMWILLATMFSYATCISILSLSDHFFVLIFTAIALSCISVQFGFLMHDAGHRQIFKKTKANNIFGYIAAFFNGTSFHSWMDGHNEHHNHPNHEDLDPDIEMYFLSYSEKQVDECNVVMRYVARYQAWLAPLFYSFSYYMMRYGSLVDTVRRHSRKIIIGTFLSSISWHIAYGGILFYLLGFWNMILFALIHHALTGLYLALVFAPNHKGMPIFEKEEHLDWFTRQVITARNIYAHPITNFLYGGLNFQIEHHLFPTMPRLQSRKAQKITKEFCMEKGVEYYETGIIQSYKEVFNLFSEVGAYAKNLRRPVHELQEQFSILIARLKSDLEDLKECELQSDIANLKERLSAKASDCIQRSKENHIIRKEKLLRAQKEVREISAAIRRYIQPLQS